jgi:hypothetical protein
MNGYRRAPATDAPGWLRETVDQAVKDAALALSIETPAVRWWCTDAGDLAAWVDLESPGEINFVIDNLRRHDVYTVRARAFHECRHVWQWETARYLGDRIAAEDDANRWARQATGYSPGLLDIWEIR